jgi:hypothetical protein
MPIIKLSGTISRISGKLQGVIFGYSANGSYIKSNSYSQPQNRPSQLVRQAQIQTSSSKWATLTQTQKNTFINEAGNYSYTNKVGEIAYYNGYQIFLYLNNNLLQAFQPLISSAPTYTPVVNATWYFLFVTTSSVFLQTTTGVANTSTKFFCTKSLPPGQEPTTQDFVWIASVSTAPGTLNVGITFNYFKILGATTVGNTVFCKVKTTVKNNGNTTEFSNVFSKIVT